MFSIETTEDIKILKELTGFSNDKRIQELETEVQQLSQANNELVKLTQNQMKVIEKINKSLVTADQCKDIVFDLLNGASKPEILAKKQKNKNKGGRPSRIEQEEFGFSKSMEKTYNKILVEGNKLIHLTSRNQRMQLPISTIELLALVEVYQYRHRKLLNKDYKNISKLYGINVAQFGKIYYNLKEGTFFNALNKIDSEIRKTEFLIKQGTIHVIDGSQTIDTKIDSKMFNEFLNIYVNSNQPYSTIYRLSKENPQINPIDLLIVLRKNKAVSKKLVQG